MHGGLRYLQNFDLGLVREALLERALMVNLAPHLVLPLPLLVPFFDGKRPDRMMGVGLNMYDVMATERKRRARPPRRGRPAGGVEPRPPPHDRRRRGARAAAGARVARAHVGGYLFYDCQTDDVRLVLTVLGEAERFGAVIANRAEVVELLEEDGRACGVLVRGPHERAASSSCAPTTW